MSCTAAYPEAFVLLSVRDPEASYRGASNTIFVGTRDEALAGDPWMVAMVRLFEERSAASWMTATP